MELDILRFGKCFQCLREETLILVSHLCETARVFLPATALFGAVVRAWEFSFSLVMKVICESIRSLVSWIGQFIATC